MEKKNTHNKTQKKETKKPHTLHIYQTFPSHRWVFQQDSDLSSELHYVQSYVGCTQSEQEPIIGFVFGVILVKGFTWIQRLSRKVKLNSRHAVGT